MSKTYKDVVKMLDKNQTKKRRGEASARFKTEKKRRDDKRFYNFTTWLEKTAQD